MRLEVWSILIIVIAFQGLFLLSVLLFSKSNRSKIGNIYLTFIVLLLTWFLAEFFCVRNKIDIGLGLFYGTRYGSWFLLGPLSYFYFKSITNVQWKFSRNDLWHFLPFVLFVIIIPFIAYKTLNDRQIDYGMLSAFDHREKTLTTVQWVYSVVFILQFVHLGFFLFKNLRIVKRYTAALKLQYSYLDDKISWLKNLNLVLIAILVFSTIFLYILLVTDIYRRHLDYIYVLPIGVLFYFISYRLMRTEWKTVENGKYASSSLNPAEIPKLKEKLNQLMSDEQVYLNSQLRLADLAKMMGIKTHHLSQLINQEYKLSFYDFINSYRTMNAKNVIKSNPEFTFVQVAFESGFNNKTSFVNAFKKFENSTPSQFRESQLNS